jgi:hypothetical protein
MTQDKARTAVNDHTLNMGRNVGLGHLQASRKARRETAIRACCIFCKGPAFALRCALRLTVARHADMCT